MLTTTHPLGHSIHRTLQVQRQASLVAIPHSTDTHTTIHTHHRHHRQQSMAPTTHTDTAHAQCPAVLRDISEGTSYQAVRLVFRHYIHLMPSSCTSERLRASSRLSPTFTQNRHSSLPFGSHTHASPHSHRHSIASTARTCSPWSVFQDGRLHSPYLPNTFIFHHSSFHTSITLLIRYRSLTHIQPSMTQSTTASANTDTHSGCTTKQPYSPHTQTTATGISPPMHVHSRTLATVPIHTTRTAPQHTYHTGHSHFTRRYSGNPC